MTAALGFSVSVVIPLFNKQDSIADTIASVLRQSRAPDEIVILDDGSTDSSVARAREALKTAEGIPFHLLSQPNAGVSAARNAGANASRSRFIAFLDGDDEWLPGYLAEVERLALAFPEATFLTTRSAIKKPDATLAPEPTTLPPDFFGLVDRPLRRLRAGRGLINSSSVTIRRDAWERSGGFPVGARQGEDIYLWLKLGLSETMAHSSAPLSILHPERSESESRKDEVGYHFAYFLGTAEGRRHLANPDLKSFLSWHLPRIVFFRRLAGHSAIMPGLRRLASALPPRPRIACWLASIAPLWLLRAVLAGRRRKSTAAGSRAASGNRAMSSTSPARR